MVTYLNGNIIMFIKIKDLRVLLEDIKTYSSTDIERVSSRSVHGTEYIHSKNIYGIDLETTLKHYTIKFSSKEERDSTLSNLDMLFNTYRNL